MCCISAISFLYHPLKISGFFVVVVLSSQIDYLHNFFKMHSGLRNVTQEFLPLAVLSLATGLYSVRSLFHHRLFLLA